LCPWHPSAAIRTTQQKKEYQNMLSPPLCTWWPLLAALLLGWLLCGWFARQFLRGPDSSGALAAKDRDVQRLTSEMAALRAQPPVEKVVEKVVEKPVDRIVEKVVEKTAEKTDAAIDLAAAKAAGFSLKNADDLEVIEGIGPKIAELFHKDGIHTFAQLSRTPTSQIQALLDAAGANFRLANPETWPDQADLAARNRWTALKAMQDGLTAGVRKA
jgi:predicted flap endonuclease-1-like 5' DNA nuclease